FSRDWSSDVCSSDLGDATSLGRRSRRRRQGRESADQRGRQSYCKTANAFMNAFATSNAKSEGLHGKCPCPQRALHATTDRLDRKGQMPLRRFQNTGASTATGHWP